MLSIKVESQELYDVNDNVFFYTKPTVVKLEHSLISVSLWESKWEKPFLATKEQGGGINNIEEEIHYISCMIIGEPPTHVPLWLYQHKPHIIREYIEKKHTATTVHRLGPQVSSRQIITSELIYCRMIELNIPVQFEKWHLNRLLTLLDVFNVRQSGKQNKMSPKESASYRAALNKARLKGD